MAAIEFRDDDESYVNWLAANPDGYVANILRSHSASSARLHRSTCRTISGQNPHGGPWTAAKYVKFCAKQLSELDEWAVRQLGQPIPVCKICCPRRDDGVPASTRPTEQVRLPRQLSDGRYEIHGPTATSAAVEAWADDYIRFERRPAWQEQLRDEIRSNCQQFEPSDEQVLHATFFGDKRHNADVENLTLYNIDTFATAGRNGIRFEHGNPVPPAPSAGEYPFCYRYTLSPHSGSFAHWQAGRTLASFNWTDLGASTSEKKLAHVWLALSRSVATAFAPATSDAPFAVRVQVRPPLGKAPVWGALVKGIFDGVICAFQAHTDMAVIPEVVTRLAKFLPADPEEIVEHLLDQRRAVLGIVHRLVAPYGPGVKWNPSDHLCVAGELLSAASADDRWAIRGEIVELAH